MSKPNRTIANLTIASLFLCLALTNLAPAQSIRGCRSEVTGTGHSNRSRVCATCGAFKRPGFSNPRESTDILVSFHETPVQQRFAPRSFFVARNESRWLCVDVTFEPKRGWRAFRP